MPELPEVETTCRGIAPHAEHQPIVSLVLRRPNLRWEIPSHLPDTVAGMVIQRIVRRSKYVLMELDNGTMLIHLGMSGSMRVLLNAESPGKHDHWDMQLANGKIIRYNDPRRFGALLWAEGKGEESWQTHDLIKKLGPEPLTDAFHARYLYQKSRGRKMAVKAFLMDAHNVVGVGNIYATESLHLSGIHPSLAAGKVSLARYEKLVTAVKNTLATAIERGGTTLRDYVNGSGNPGYFQQELLVYGRQGEPCRGCGTAIKSIKIGQRASCFCPRCQR